MLFNLKKYGSFDILLKIRFNIPLSFVFIFCLHFILSGGRLNSLDCSKFTVCIKDLYELNLALMVWF